MCYLTINSNWRKFPRQLEVEAEEDILFAARTSRANGAREQRRGVRLRLSGAKRAGGRASTGEAGEASAVGRIGAEKHGTALGFATGRGSAPRWSPVLCGSRLGGTLVDAAVAHGADGVHGGGS